MQTRNKWSSRQLRHLKLKPVEEPVVEEKPKKKAKAKAKPKWPAK